MDQITERLKARLEYLINSQELEAKEYRHQVKVEFGTLRRDAIADKLNGYCRIEYRSGRLIIPLTKLAYSSYTGPFWHPRVSSQSQTAAPVSAYNGSDALLGNQLSRAQLTQDQHPERSRKRRRGQSRSSGPSSDEDSYDQKHRKLKEYKRELEDKLKTDRKEQESLLKEQYKVMSDKYKLEQDTRYQQQCLQNQATYEEKTRAKDAKRELKERELEEKFNRKESHLEIKFDKRENDLKQKEERLDLREERLDRREEELTARQKNSTQEPLAVD